VIGMPRDGAITFSDLIERHGGGTKIEHPSPTPAAHPPSRQHSFPRSSPVRTLQRLSEGQADRSHATAAIEHVVSDHPVLPMLAFFLFNIRALPPWKFFNSLPFTSSRGSSVKSPNGFQGLARIFSERSFRRMKFDRIHMRNFAILITLLIDV